MPGPSNSALDELLDVYDTQRNAASFRGPAQLWRRKRLIFTGVEAERGCAHFPIFLLAHTPPWQTSACSRAIQPDMQATFRVWFCLRLKIKPPSISSAFCAI